MKNYHVIIIGAGIAGTGLAFNLARYGFKGKVLILDKRGVGSNAAYGLRNTFKEIVLEYDLPYRHKFQGVNFGDTDKIFITVDHDFYGIDYKKSCVSLLSRSNAEFRLEHVRRIKEGKLITNKGIYCFTYLVDCSGAAACMRRALRLPLPFKYFCGLVRRLQSPVPVADDYFSYLEKDDGTNQDIYFMGQEILQGDWVYSKRIDFKKIQIYSMSLYKKELLSSREITRHAVAIPVSLTPPLVYGNVAFLGDSLGNATPVAGEGIRPILHSSHLLARAIVRADLCLYEREWEAGYLDNYCTYLSTKMNMDKRFRMSKLLKKYPDLFMKGLMNAKVNLPDSVKKKIPISVKMRHAFYYYFLHLDYQFKKILSKSKIYTDHF